MRYVSNLKGWIDKKEKVKALVHKSPIVLFLLNEKESYSSEHGEDGDFNFIFHLEAEEDFKVEEPLILGMYNGSIGTMDVDLNSKSFVQKGYMGDALSNQLAIYLIQELLFCPEEDKSYLENMIVTMGDYLVKRVCLHKKMSCTLKMGITPYQLRKIHRYIIERIDRQICTHELAGIVELSVHHFIRMFKRTTGLTPHQFTTRLKMDRAKELLLSTDDTIIQVGMGIGCDNPSHFSQLFKSNFGITPLKFRKAFHQMALSA